jgi:uncharacterized membrane protein
MAAYIFTLIWFISAVVCLYIATKRHLKQSFLRNLVVVLLGPFAIPLVFFLKADGSVQSNQ